MWSKNTMNPFAKTNTTTGNTGTRVGGDSSRTSNTSNLFGRSSTSRVTNNLYISYY